MSNDLISNTPAERALRLQVEAGRRLVAALTAERDGLRAAAPAVVEAATPSVGSLAEGCYRTDSLCAPLVALKAAVDRCVS